MIASDPVAEGPIAALRAQRDAILARWLEAARAQPFHQQNPENAVTDHMPRLLDALLRSLEEGVASDEIGQAAALAHARVRTAQGLDSGDMVTEFRLLRGELQRSLSEGPLVGTDELLRLESRLNDELDGLITAALRAFDALAHARAGGLDAMGRVAREISGLRPLDETLHLVCDRARDLLEADQATIALPDTDGDLVFRASSGSVVFSVLEARLAPGEGITGQAFASGIPACTSVPGAPALAPVERTGGIRALLVVPVRRGSVMVGTLGVGSIMARDWTADEIALLEGLAAQAAVGLDNARLYGALERRERLLNQVVHSAPALIAVIRGPDQRYELVNPRYQAISPDSPLTGQAARHVHDERLGGIIEPALHQALGGEPVMLEDVPIEAREEGYEVPITRYFTFSYLPLAESASDEAGVLVVGYETTDAVAQRARIEALARLAAARADTLAAVIGAMPDGVYVCDVDRTVVMANRSGAELLGLSDAEVLKPLAYFTSTNLRSADGRSLALEEYPLVRALGGEVGTNQDILIRRADTGEDRLLRVSLAPIRDAGGTITGGVCVAHDVTTLRQLERQKDEFVGRVSHELKTPLTSAKGLLQLALRRLARSDQGAQFLPMLETAERQIDRLAVLVDDLRSVSQLRAGHFRLRLAELDLRDLLREAVQSLQTTTAQHVLRLQESAEPLRVQGDPTRLAQVLDNLLSNAIKYSPDGGDVEVRCRGGDGRAIVEIQDHGIGIPPQDWKALFEPFQRASNADMASTGMGLGLYISREIARQHGGDLQLVQSGPEGSTFRLILPLFAEASLPSEPVHQPAT